MMIKRILQVLAMALAAMALALPATASAVVWTHEGEPLEVEKTIFLQGTFAFSTGPAGISCTETEAKVILEPGSTGTIEELALASCTGQGTLSGCITHGQAQELPWLIHAEEEEIFRITELVIIYPILPKCGGGQVSINSVAGVTLVPLNPAAIALINVNGAVATSLEGGAPATAAGQLSVAAPDSETYGIE